MQILKLDGLCKQYPAFRLENVSFSMEAGTIMGLIGRNGAGKTTTLKSMAGILKFDEGEIEIGGVSVKKNPLKCEYFLPFVVDELIREGKAEVTVLKSHDRWHGVTYKEDKPVVMKAMQDLKDAGKYPQNLWEE